MNWIVAIAFLTVLFGAGLCADELAKKAGSPFQHLEFTGKKESSSYAKAVEAICKQAGWRWQITHDGPGGTPVLVIRTGNKS